MFTVRRSQACDASLDHAVVNCCWLGNAQQRALHTTAGRFPLSLCSRLLCSTFYRSAAALGRLPRIGEGHAPLTDVVAPECFNGAHVGALPFYPPFEGHLAVLGERRVGTVDVFLGGHAQVLACERVPVQGLYLGDCSLGGLTESFVRIRTLPF